MSCWCLISFVEKINVGWGWWAVRVKKKRAGWAGMG
jgi:hypothetical protein